MNDQILVAESGNVQATKTRAKRPKLGVLDDVIETAINEAVKDIVGELTKQEVLKYIPQRLEVVRHKTIVETIDRQHNKFELALKTLTSGVNVYLTGPSGTGKTTLAYNISKALGLPFVLYQCHRDMSSYDFEGSLSVTSNEYAPSKLYSAYKNGGVILFDELDNISSSAGVAANALLANDFFTFPNGETATKHKDCYMLAAGNTLGLGSNDQFVARTKIDAATLDRFAYLDLQIDTALEYSACGIHSNSQDKIDLDRGGVVSKEAWIRFVGQFREYLKEVGLKQVVITPRASISGCKLIDQGIGFAHIAEMLLFRHLSPEQKSKVSSWVLGNRPY